MTLSIDDNRCVQKLRNTKITNFLPAAYLVLTGLTRRFLAKALRNFWVPLRSRAGTKPFGTIPIAGFFTGSADGSMQQCYTVA